MTNRDKNLVKIFLTLSGLAKETIKREEEALTTLGNLINYLPAEKKKEAVRLQSDLDDLFELIKWDYMDYGANLNMILEEYDLDWTPAVMDKINEEVRKENVA
jgi:hypothetical protein|nr:MAG TPA_asm: hypothetical protein [Caudoviricetes sp.]